MSLARPSRFAPIVFLAILLVGAPLQNSQAQTVPGKPSADVPQPASLPATQPTQASEPAAKPAPQQLDIDFTDGKVTVDATNASLNTVVNDVAAKARIKVSGAVSDERVFGHYGPAAPSVILATLLDGTGSNMLLVDDAQGASELILTQRVGGPTPPNPNAAAAERAAEQQEERLAPRYGPPNRPFQPGRGPLAVPPNFGSGIPIGGRPDMQTGRPSNQDSSESAQPSSEPKTPQQIYDDLQNQQKPAVPQPPQ